MNYPNLPLAKRAKLSLVHTLPALPNSGYWQLTANLPDKQKVVMHGATVLSVSGRMLEALLARDGLDLELVRYRLVRCPKR